MEEKKKPPNKKEERSSRNNRNDPPIIFYDKSTARRQAPLAEPVEEAEMTVTSTSESHSGFMIEFSDSSSPKMARKEKNLRDMVPKSLRSKMEASARLAEERRASRMSRSQSQEFIKSPRESPTSYKRMKELWAQAKDSAKESHTESEPNGCADFDQRRSLDDSPEKVNDHACKPKRRSQPSPVVTVEEEEVEDGADNVSETGTYTIESDAPSKDLIEARANIDEVFGVGQGTGSDADTDKDVSDEEMEEEVVESKGKKKTVPGAKDVWVEEWASNTSQRSNGTEGCHDTEDIAETSGRSAKSPRAKQTSPAKKNGQQESPSRGQRLRRLLPAVPSVRKKPNGCMSPPLSPEPKSEPFMRTSQSAFSFPSVNGLSVDNTNTRNISKSSTKLSVEDADNTEIFLKDTETLMHHLEERMKKQRIDSDEDHVSFSKDVVTDDDTSEVFDTVSNSEQSSVGLSAPTTSLSSKKGRASPGPKTSSRWSRLSTPNKHKVATQSEQEKGSKAKGSQAKPQTKSAETKSSNFQRNTYRTSSLPSDSGEKKKRKKDSSSASSASSKLKQQSSAQKASAPSKSKQSVVLPRQTRSTLLRNKRFAGSSGNIADVSPASSISDLSSSKASLNPWRKKSLPNIHQDNKFSCSDSDVGIYSTRKQKGGTSTRSETKAAVKKTAGSRDRSKSMGESSLKSGSQTSHKKTVTAPTSTRISKTAVKSPSTIEAYINSVRERRVDGPKAPSKAKEVARTVAKKQHQSGLGEDQSAALEIDESQDFVNDLDDLSKEENTVDEILGHDTFTTPSIVYTRPSRGMKANRQKKLEFRLKRCSSLDLGDEYPKDLPFERKSLLKRHGPGDNHQGKPEPRLSFDDLVLSSINHLSKKLRDSTDQLLTKVNPSTTQAIPHPEMERDYPFLKTENREIAHILHNLRKMERKLEEIHSFVDNKGESRPSSSTKRMTPSRRWNKPPDIIQSEETMI